MSFVIFDERDNRLQMGSKTYATARGANSSAVFKIKRLLKYGRAKEAAEIAENWTVISLAEYNLKHRKTKTVVNLMSGKEIEIDINTPASCDPSTETYWSC